MRRSRIWARIWSSLKRAARPRGGMVHWAADAAEARRIILEILREEKA